MYPPALNKPTLPVTVSLPFGLLALFWGMTADLFLGLPHINAYTLLGIVFLVHFLQELPTKKHKLAGWGLWFGGLFAQIGFTLATDQYTFVLPLGLIGALLIIHFQQKGQAFNAMLVMVALIVLPFQWGSLIGISAMTMSGLKSEQQRWYSLLFAVALTLSNLSLTGGFSLLVFVASGLIYAWEAPEEQRYTLSFQAFVLGVAWVYSVYVLVIFLTLFLA